jgi:hypothetical protein
MRNFLTAKWRRFAAAFVVVAASLGVIGACSPIKKDQPPPPPQCVGADSNTETCLTIQPSSQTFTAGGQTFSFTITNQGPGVAQLITTNTEAEFIGSVTQHNCEFPKKLAPGESCSVAVTSFDNAIVPQGTPDYVRQVCSNCQVTPLPPPFQNFRGVAARIVGQY